MTMHLQYIIDKKGHKSAVQLPMKDWEQIQKDLGGTGTVGFYFRFYI